MLITSTQKTNGHYGLQALLAPVLLTLALWLVAVFVPSHNSTEQLAFGDGFPGVQSAWQLDPPDASAVFSNGITLSSGSVRMDRVSLAKDIQGRSGELVQLKASVQVSSETPALNPDGHGQGTAALALWFYDKPGNLLGYKNVFFIPNRYRSAQVSKVTVVPQQATQVVVGLVSGPGAQTFTVIDAGLDIVATNPRYKPLLFILVLGWVIFFAVSARWVIRSSGPVVQTMLLGGVLVMLLGVTIPTDILAAHMQPLLAFMEPLTGDQWERVLGLLMKLGHASGFLFLSVCLLFVNRRSGGDDLPIMLLVFIFALASEVAQMHIPDRQASLLDLLIDSAGILFGWVVMLFLTRKPQHS